MLKLSRKEKNPLAQARLRAFYQNRTGQLQSYTLIGRQLGYERQTIGKWFKLYRGKGLAACLQINPVGNPSGSRICGEALEELKRRLSDERDHFSAYKQIQQWLEEAYAIVLSYEQVHHFVYHNVGARLKVVRKSNLKKDPQQEEAFKKKQAGC